nr:hypothetical protein [Halomonas elongata]
MELGLVEHLIDPDGATGIAPWVFFMPASSTLARRSSMGSTSRRSASSSTIISVAAMVCRVP